VFYLIIVLTILLAGIGSGFLMGVFLHKKRLADAFQSAQNDSRSILDEARREADRLLKNSIRDSKEESRKMRQTFDEETRNRRNEITKLENKIRQREQQLEKKISIIEKREEELGQTQEKLNQDEQRYTRMIGDCERTIEQSRRMLEKIANMSAEDARLELMRSLEAQARKDARETLKQIEEETKREAETRARAVISLAVQRVSSEYVNDQTISVVGLPSEDMKGRIIGREGRNIRAIEQATGVDLIIDDTPEAVIISCFNPIRREIAKITLDRLIADGRIHPARIEETVKRVETEFDQIIRENGEQACFDAGITDLHPELVKALGKLKYRTSGQQSILQHSVEVANICGMMAQEMKLNAKKARRAGLLHDIGKSVDHEVEGHHSTVGADMCAKYGEADDVVQAIRSHHTEDLSLASPYEIILHTSNLMSSARPKARKDTLDTYIKRLEELEKTAATFPGIDQAFVIQAGREVRCMVTPSNVADKEVIDLASDIASKLRQELTFPGQVKVTVIRESKAMDLAK
jgi:ribonuclease Y